MIAPDRIVAQASEPMVYLLVAYCDIGLQTIGQTILEPRFAEQVVLELDCDLEADIIPRGHCRLQALENQQTVVPKLCQIERSPICGEADPQHQVRGAIKMYVVG